MAMPIKVFLTTLELEMENSTEVNTLTGSLMFVPTNSGMNMFVYYVGLE